MARRRDDEDGEIREGQQMYAEDQKQARFDREQQIFDEKFEQMNGLAFVWEGQQTDPCAPGVIQKGFELSGNGDFLEKYEPWFVGGMDNYYYISDQPVGSRNNVEALGNKYKDDRRFLNPGNEYFLNQI